MTDASVGHHVGFLGFGRVAAALAKQLGPATFTITAYDVNVNRRGGPELLAERATGTNVKFGSLLDVLQSADFVFAAVPPGEAATIAGQASDHLDERHTYIDLTSVGPAEKQRIAAVVTRTGARFIEAAILDSVGAAGGRARILVCGPGAERTAAILGDAGLNIRSVGPNLGGAACLKMLRSVCSKGLEALLLEAFVAAAEAHVEHELWMILEDFFESHGFAASARDWIVSHPGAAERRCVELKEVVATLEGLRTESVMTSATLKFFERSIELGLPRSFTGELAAEPGEVIRELARLASRDRLGGLN